jgi:hypothetical protein
MDDPWRERGFLDRWLNDCARSVSRGAGRNVGVLRGFLGDVFRSKK